jgi:glycerol dehydrogenase
VIWDNALPALDAVRDHQVTPAVEKLVEANTLLSGLGFESGGLAAAHAIHNGLTAAHQTHGLAHGQKVNIGSVTQLVLEGAPTQEIRDFIEFTTRVGLPNTLTEVGLSVDDEDDLRRVAEAATAPGETIHNMPFEISPDELVSALKSIERFSRTVRSEAHLPAPVQYVAAEVDTH